MYLLHGYLLNFYGSCKIIRLQVRLDNFIIFIFYFYILLLLAEDPGVRGRLNECLETILNKAQEPPKSKKVQHSNAKNAVLFEAISLIIHNDR